MDVYGRVARLLLEMAEEDTDGQQVVMPRFPSRTLPR
jgi:hypothetical protein